MSRRRRPHPARRARRVAGATAIGAYAGLLVSVGWGQRAAENAAEPIPVPGDTSPERWGVERLDLSAAATFVPSATVETAGPAFGTVPAPPPPPTVAVTTTTLPRTTTAPAGPSPSSPPTPTAAPATAESPTTTTAPASTLPPPTAPPPTSLPPPTSVPTGGS